MTENEIKLVKVAIEAVDVGNFSHLCGAKELEGVGANYLKALVAYLREIREAIEARKEAEAKTAKGIELEIEAESESVKDAAYLAICSDLDSQIVFAKKKAEDFKTMRDESIKRLAVLSSLPHLPDFSEMDYGPENEESADEGETERTFYPYEETVRDIKICVIGPNAFTTKATAQVAAVAARNCEINRGRKYTLYRMADDERIKVEFYGEDNGRT